MKVALSDFTCERISIESSSILSSAVYWRVYCWARQHHRLSPLELHKFQQIIYRFMRIRRKKGSRRRKGELEQHIASKSWPRKIIIRNNFLFMWKNDFIVDWAVSIGWLVLFIEAPTSSRNWKIFSFKTERVSGWIGEWCRRLSSSLVHFVLNSIEWNLATGKPTPSSSRFLLNYFW